MNGIESGEKKGKGFELSGEKMEACPKSAKRYDGA